MSREVDEQAEASSAPSAGSSSGSDFERLQRLRPRPVRRCSGALRHRPQSTRAPASFRPAGELVGEARLADAALAADEEEPPATRRCVLERGAARRARVRVRRRRRPRAAGPGWPPRRAGRARRPGAGSTARAPAAACRARFPARRRARASPRGRPRARRPGARQRYSASISCARSRSRSGYRATSASSSPTSSSVRAERQVGVDPVLEGRQVELLEPGCLAAGEGFAANSASGVPRQSSSASVSVSRAAAASPARAARDRPWRAPRSAAGRSPPGRLRAGSRPGASAARPPRGRGAGGKRGSAAPWPRPPEVPPSTEARSAWLSTRPRSRAGAEAPGARAAWLRRAGSCRPSPSTSSGPRIRNLMKAPCCRAETGLQPHVSHVGRRPHRAVGTKGRHREASHPHHRDSRIGPGARPDRLGAGSLGRRQRHRRRGRYPDSAVHGSRDPGTCCPAARGSRSTTGWIPRRRPSCFAAPASRTTTASTPDVPARHPRRQRRLGHQPDLDRQLLRLEHDYRRNPRGTPPRGDGGYLRHPAQAQPQLLTTQPLGETTSGPSGPLVVWSRLFRIAAMAQPFRIGVMQLTMEPRRRDARDGARPRRARLRHDLARRGVPVVAQAPDGGALVHGRLGADGAGDGAADDRLGDHLAVHAASRPGGDGRARRAGARAGPLHPRLRDVEDLPQQRADADEQDARADARRRGDRARRARRRRVPLRRRDVERRRAGDGRRRAARRAARVRRRDGAEDAGARGRDRRRLPDAVDHDARVRPLHARERAGGHRHRLHGRRVDRRGSRRRPRRRARDRRDVPREQGAEHQGRRRHAARARRDRRRRRSGRSPRRWSAAGGSRRRSR